MKTRTIISVATALITGCVFTCMVRGQGISGADGWRGLRLDRSAPEEVIKALGAPVKDKMGTLECEGIDGWITKRRKEKIFRNLEFKEPGSHGKVILSFLDGKLVKIRLEVKETPIFPLSLPKMYGIKFLPLIYRSDIKQFKKDYARDEVEGYLELYPPVYQLVGLSERSFVVAKVDRMNFISNEMAKSLRLPEMPKTHPGRVAVIEVFSRTLEKRDAASK